MKVKVLLAAMGLVFAGSALAAGPYNDSTDIHFAGEVYSNLCAVDVDGGSTVTLDPTNAKAVEGQSGSALLNEKVFSINVDCSGATTAITDEGFTTMTGYLTAASGTEVDAATQALKNTDVSAAGAVNVGFGVKDNTDKLQTFTSADIVAKPLTAGDNKYKFDYKVGYMKVASGVTAGKVAADSTFMVNYQ
ncbi:fimbrial protein [Citrobacter werkmanii]|nr:fimbrial protein [Citrobacter werkmanii]ATF48231.1 fimbrial protein [Citrobacter werkmanii]